MCIKIGLLLISCHRAEHGIIVHIMSVQYGMFVSKCRVATIIHKDRSRTVDRPVHHMGQIIFVVGSLHHRIIQCTVRQIHPCHNIRVLLYQCREIYKNKIVRFCQLICLSFRLTGRCRLWQFHIRCQGFIRFFAFSILHPNPKNLI